MSYLDNPNAIEGTTMFDGTMARKGYDLNKMCYSLNNAEARAAFSADEMTYCDKFNLTDAQKQAIANRDVLGLIAEGGSIYYLAKFVGLLGLNMQDIGAIQTGVTLEEFNQKLRNPGS